MRWKVCRSALVWDHLGGRHTSTHVSTLGLTLYLIFFIPLHVHSSHIPTHVVTTQNTDRRRHRHCGRLYKIVPKAGSGGVLTCPCPYPLPWRANLQRFVDMPVGMLSVSTFTHRFYPVGLRCEHLRAALMRPECARSAPHLPPCNGPPCVRISLFENLL